ncbi:CocE/NonD family hydrolase [Pelagibaculum spongiae]|nr:CocE/NonD family hydrolase [Pelagibaculum spongiae]
MNINNNKKKHIHGLRLLISVALFFFCQISLAETNTKSLYSYQEDVVVTSADGIRLSANLRLPTSGQASYPAVIFFSSWALTEHQYEHPAAFLAKRGYIVLAINSRGFHTSEGTININSDQEMADASAAIDWLEQNTPVEVGNVSLAGISYGAGIALKAAALEPRVKTVIAMSGWASLYQSLYRHETPRTAWTDFLINSGKLTGNLSSEVKSNYQNLLNIQNVSETIAWADYRSPASYIDQLNQRNVPVFISNNFQDNLFQPNQMLDFYQQLTTPKHLELNQGLHGVGEGGAMAGIVNSLWVNAFNWLDYWQKGIDNGIMQQAAVVMELDSVPRVREGFSDWPVAMDQMQLALSHRENNEVAMMAPQRSSEGSVTIYSGRDSRASTGNMAIIGTVLDVFEIKPVTVDLSTLRTRHGIGWQTEPLLQTTKIRGITDVQLTITPSQPRVELVGYLYRINPKGIANLISHSPITLQEATPGERINIEFQLTATASNIAAGDRIGFALDTQDLLYQKVNEDFNIEIHLDQPSVSAISIPVIGSQYQPEPLPHFEPISMNKYLETFKSNQQDNSKTSSVKTGGGSFEIWLFLFFIGFYLLRKRLRTHWISFCMG